MHGLSKEELEAIRNSGLFDAEWYLKTYPDVKALGMDPLEHFLWLGHKLRRRPSPNFDLDRYLEEKSRKALVPSTALAEYLSKEASFSNRSGQKSDPKTTAPQTHQHEHAVNSKNPEIALIQPHFDEEWYREQLKQATLDVPDAIGHFVESGWKLGLSPNRWFDTLGYVAANKDVAKAKINPFLHFLKNGRQEKRSPNPFFINRNKKPDILNRRFPSEYGPIEKIISFSQITPDCTVNSERLCVHVHMFYQDMIEDVLRIINRIPIAYTLLVSIPEHADEERCKKYFHQHAKKMEHIVVKAVQNKGRDIAPWVVTFKDEIESHELFCHFHTKRSRHASEHKFWFRFLSHTMFGSREVISQIINLFQTDKNIGLISPGYWSYLRSQPNFGKTEQIFNQLLERSGVQDVYNFCPDFPAGSFWWCRTKILKPLLQLGLKFEDFPEEAGQTCGTLAHAIERFIGTLPKAVGMRTVFVAVDWPHELAEQRPLSVKFGRDNLCYNSTLSVSVIMPVWNRKNSVVQAIKSALNQSYPPAEVIVVDDGSTDETLDVVKSIFSDYIREGKLKLICNSHKGVSVARNSGLDIASGDIIAYLDSDNIWRKDYLLNIVTAYERFPDTLSVYTDFLLHDADIGASKLYNREYDRSSLVDRNFIDLNIFSHRRSFIDEGYRFDEKLKRLVDWDFILNVTKLRAPMHISYVGVDYHLNKGVMKNITRTVPLEDNMRHVRLKHRKELVYWGHEKLNVVIKCPAPKPEVAHEWGDYHFAKSLCRALEKKGCRTRIDFLKDWYDADSDSDDVVLVLRGLSRYKPKPGRINLIWLISHPDKVDIGELQEYNHVFVASYRHTLTLMPLLGSKVSVLMQCSDPDVFCRADADELAPEHELLFVGNSRGVERWIPKVCVEKGLPISVYGAAWKGKLPQSVIKGDHIINDVLASYYRKAKIVLNDHWPSMSSGGFISNRIFDAGLSKSFVVSDDFQDKEIFFDNVVTCKSAEEIENNVKNYIDNESARSEKSENLYNIVRLLHTFENRSEEIVRIIWSHMGMMSSLSVGAPHHLGDSLDQIVD